jgi:glycosyltransferase involved in cell wall biosynthesis
MSSRRVGIIVPAYNYAHYLPQALDSVLAQTYPDWECVIVDDGSTDNTAEVVRQYVERDPRFRYVHQENRGHSGARNTGVRVTDTPLVQFLDADDRLLPDKLERHVRYLDEHPETDIVYSEVAFFRSDDPNRLFASLGGKLSRSIMARVHGVDEAREKLQHYCIMTINAALLRRHVFDAAGVFDEAAPGSEDYALWIRCAAAGMRFDFCGPDDPVAAVRAHTVSNSRDYRRMQAGLIAAARLYAQSPQARLWPDGKTPVIYQFAKGLELAGQGRRGEGARTIWKAASEATESLTAWRWRVYAAAAMLLPREFFLSFAAHPIPERPFEIYRRIRALFT